MSANRKPGSQDASGGSRRWGIVGQVPSGPQAAQPDPDEALPRQYDESLFLIGIKGSGPGEMERQDFKLHESYISWARRIVESGRFGRISKSDIYRLGTILALRWLDSLAPEAVERSVMHQIAQIEEVEAWERRQLRFVKVIDSIGAVIAEQLALPHGKVQAARMLRRIKGHISKMERNFYQAHFEKMFDERFSAHQRAGLLCMGAVGEEDGGAELAALEMGAEQLDDESGDGGGEVDELAGALLREITELIEQADGATCHD